MFRQQVLVIAPGQHRRALAQRNQLLIGIKHGFRVRQRCFGVNLAIVVAQRNPRLACGESAVFTTVPLHGRAAVIARFTGQNRQQFIRVPALSRAFDIHVVALNVAIIGDARKVRISHANLFALINIGRALHAVQHHRQHFRRRDAVFPFITETGDDARLIVVTPEQRIPGAIVHSLLPVPEQRFQRHKIRSRQRPLLSAGVVHLQMVEVKGHREFAAVERRIFLAMFKRGGGHFAHRHQISRGEDIAAHLLQKFVRSRTVGIKAAAIASGIGREGLVFGDNIDHVEAQAVDAAIGPKFADFFQLCAHGRVFPVQIRLLNGVQMQIVLLAFGVPLPGVAAKLRLPVVRRGGRLAVAPDIELAIRTLFAERFPEPGMLGRSVVQHHIQHDTNSSRLRLSHQLVEIVQRAVGGVDSGIVGHIVAVIHLRRDIERRQPDSVNAKLLQIVEAGGDTAQIAGTGAGRILETLRIDLINNAVLPPEGKGIHIAFLLQKRGATARPENKMSDNL
ncbi:Uncharacterised protein [Klebsiella oxytoca]|nr:Uncharacterised protein [Klebsiella oxytoca]